MNKKAITTSTIKAMKQQGEPITMVTAYDVAMARNVNEAGVEMILVGDSVGNVMLGYGSTVPVTMEEMLHHTKAVMRACGLALVVADMPFMSYQASIADGLYNAARFLKETGCTAVKLEGGSEICELVQKMVAAGIPVVGHIGLTPAALAAKVTAELKTAATIGIGAGNSCDGQVLVCNDLLGFSDGFCPKFAKKYSDLHGSIVSAVQQYIREVKERSFPAPEHTFKIDDEVLEKLY